MKRRFRPYAWGLDDLPTTIRGLCEVVQGPMIYRAFAGYPGLETSDDRQEQADLRATFGRNERLRVPPVIIGCARGGSSQVDLRA
ncbi:MAG: hypothetical protein PVH41_00950 [Anaerolineae bacterium]|jgi:hypothetical protein